ncbi:MAG: hypothetical protein LLF83_01340, partial [Methanobacterium sp.]|nr:hypothetical protein [Methanobacterium sp.]
AVVQMIQGKNVKKVTIKSLAVKKVICIFPTLKAAKGKWNVKITNADGTSGTNVGGFTVKSKKSANEIEAGPVSGIVSNTPLSVPSTEVPSQGSTSSGGGLVLINAPPIVRPVIQAI